jgi:hypothetical protein
LTNYAINIITQRTIIEVEDLLNVASEILITVILTSTVFWDITHVKTTPWSESARKLYRPRDRRLSAKLVTTFADRGCHVVSMTDPYGNILGFLDRSRNK